MASVVGVLCALLFAPAYAAEAESADAGGSRADVFAAFHRVADPVLAINKDDLFRRQFDWVAVENVNFDSANEDGSLSEWQANWFISHDWSDYGAVIATLNAGDAVTVNGQTVLILGRSEWPSGSINWDIYDVIGWDKIVFQTCLGDSAIWIAYGLPVHPTPDFLAEHQ